MNTIVVKKGTTKKINHTYVLEYEIDWCGEQKLIWIRSSVKFDNQLKEKSADWVAIALLIPAMRIGAKLTIRGSVSPGLYFSMQNEL